MNLIKISCVKYCNIDGEDKEKYCSALFTDRLPFLSALKSQDKRTHSGNLRSEKA
jgi:hypothetical protein